MGETVVGVLVDSAVGDGDGAIVSVGLAAGEVCVGRGAVGGISVTLGDAIASTAAWGTTFVAHPRSSIRSRMTARIMAMIVLNRSYSGALARFMIHLFPASQVACLLQQGVFVCQALYRFAQYPLQISRR